VVVVAAVVVGGGVEASGADALVSRVQWVAKWAAELIFSIKKSYFCVKNFCKILRSNKRRLHK
jgi:hypothetical protein